MTRRRRRSGRRTGWSKRLRRILVEHRFNAAQGVLGLIALVAGLWLLWPPSQRAPLDQRQVWERSLQGASGGPSEGEDAAPRARLTAEAEASMAVSAQGEALAAPPVQHIQPEQSALAHVASTMPVIGVPEAEPSAEVAGRLAVELPHDVAAEPPEPSATATARGETIARPTAPLAVDGSTPTWLRNAVATPPADGRSEIAVVIDDLGLNRTLTAELNHLKAPLTLAFMPYAGALEQQAAAAHAAGHELLVHVPMEPTGNDWPGPNALLSSLSPVELVSRLRAQLRSFRGFVGINNHMGSLLTSDHHEMALVMAELRSRGLLFLDSRTTAQSVAPSEAYRAGVPFAVRDVFLDNEQGLDYVRRQLLQTERIARRRGVAVAIGHPHDVTIEALRGWLPTLEERGFDLVPVSEVVARKSCANGLLVAASACGRYVSAHNLVQ